MEHITFYAEWLSLPKAEFNILTMLVEQGGAFRGNLSDLCRYFNVTPQQKNRTPLRSAIKSLTSTGFISSELNGRTYHLKLIPQEEEIRALKPLVQSILRHDYSGETVAAAPVIKVLLWTIRNEKPVVTNAEIAADLGISESTVVSAKNVLQIEYETLTRKKVSAKLGENFFKTLGQALAASAWYTDL